MELLKRLLTVHKGVGIVLGCVCLVGCLGLAGCVFHFGAAASQRADAGKVKKAIGIEARSAAFFESAAEPGEGSVSSETNASFDASLAKPPAEPGPG